MMQLEHLTLRNIGPFIEAEMDVTDAEGQPAPVVLITGENGTGKSIILDAIRGMFGLHYVQLERDIRRRDVVEAVKIELTLAYEETSVCFKSDRFRTVNENYHIESMPRDIRSKPQRVREKKAAPNWIVDYWPSTLATGAYQVNALSAPQHDHYLQGALQGQKTKQNITQLICHFDYLRDSKDPAERATGEKLYAILETIIADSLLNGGYLSHVARATYDPTVVQNGQAVPLANLSGGNAYLIQNMVSLLGKMYAVHQLNQTPPETLAETPGMLLIDEAENQLHPKWQKRLIANILKVFPNLQIVATTHSPFIIASAPEARLFVCHAQVDHCTLSDETGTYSNRPVDEILMSPLFEATRPFNAKITRLLEKREAAIRDGDTVKRAAIERELQAMNPTYFSYFDIEQMLADLESEAQPA
jgi:predicted ATPase